MNGNSSGRHGRRAMIYDTTPTPRFLEALQSQKWSAAGALAELVDNSLGEGRGHATHVWITWNPRTRVLEILDDGQGMEEVGRLFHLGSKPIQNPNDIGKYGSGGTYALLWLGDEASVFTLQDTNVQSHIQDWPKVMSSDSFPKISNVWQRADKGNTPPTLLKLGHGTLIRVRSDSERRRVHLGNIRRDLAVKYAPALKSGKGIFVTLAGERAKSLDLDMPTLESPVSGTLDAIGGVDSLSAMVEAGTVPNLSATLKGAIMICYGHRTLFQTKECFRGENGKTYDGSDVLGWVFLSPAWKDFLAVTKDDINNDGLKAALISAVHELILPLLQSIKQDHMQLVLNEIARSLRGILGDGFKPHHEEIRPGNEHILRTGKGQSRKHGKGILTINQRTDVEMDGCLFRAPPVLDEKRVEVDINIEHEDVVALLDQRRKLPQGLYHALLREVSQTIAQHEEILSRMFRKEENLMAAMDARPEWASQILTRHLMDKRERSSMEPEVSSDNVAG